MTDTRVSVLTPPGRGAIAVLTVRGPSAGPVIRALFRRAGGRQAPEGLSERGVWFGRLGDQAADDIILTAHAPDHFEIQCHGGRRVVGWILEVFRSNGIEEGAAAAQPSPAFADPSAASRMPFARTVRTAAILLDQAHGAYTRAVEQVEAGGSQAEAWTAKLRRNARVGGHLVEPWKVVIAGAPNAGKSSLLNALAGFDRSVVSPIPGTTRDAVSVCLAFDGWPADLFDTAGVRDSPDALEREGVDRARAAMTESNLMLWVVDASGPRPRSLQSVAEPLELPATRVLIVFNKTDISQVPMAELPEAIRVSARTGAGIADLAARIALALVPEAPAPGEPVPYTPTLSARWS